LAALGVTFALFLLGLCSGAERFPLSGIAGFFYAALSGGEPDRFLKVILIDLRLPRTLLALLCGALLAAAGTLFQGLFRNGLADPYGIGISSGATLGVTLVSVLGMGFGSALMPRLLSGGMTGFFAFCGALGTAVLVYVIAGLGRGSAALDGAAGTAGLLLTGMAVSAFFSAVTAILLLSKNEQLHRIFLWTMGSFNGKGWSELFPILPVGILSFLLAAGAAGPLDLLGSGERSAASMGVDTGKTRALVMCAASLATAAAVSAGGTIGFIGLIAPHIARLLFGPVHRKFLPAAALIGADLLLLADILARTLVPPAELPVGVVTALLGAPFFLWLLISGGGKKGNRSGVGGAERVS
jgi:iron complex transport system permease protein